MVALSLVIGFHVFPDGCPVALCLQAVAFTRWNTSQNGSLGSLWLINVDGSGERMIHDNVRNPRTPVWSPDGSQIAFTSDRSGNFDLYIMDVDGTNVVQLTDEPGLDDAGAWSPDGEHIVFVSDRNGNFDLYIMDADGSNVAHLTDDVAYDDFPDW